MMSELDNKSSKVTLAAALDAAVLLVLHVCVGLGWRYEIAPSQSSRNLN